MRTFSRILSLMLCAAILLSLTAAIPAFATEFDPAAESIQEESQAAAPAEVIDAEDDFSVETADDDWKVYNYYIDSFQELKDICTQFQEGSMLKQLNIYYEGTEDFVFTSNLQFPYNTYFYALNCHAVIPAGVNVTFDGYRVYLHFGSLSLAGYLSTATVHVKDNCNISGELSLFAEDSWNGNGMLHVGGDCKISGTVNSGTSCNSVNVDGSCDISGDVNTYNLSVYGSSMTITGKVTTASVTLDFHTVLTGVKNIAYFAGDGLITRREVITNQTELLDFLKASSDLPKTAIYIRGSGFTFTESVTIPSNCRLLVVESNLTVPANTTLTLECHIANLYATLTVGGKLVNNVSEDFYSDPGYLDVWYDQGGMLKIEASGSYSGPGDICVDTDAYNPKLTNPAPALPGLDLSNFSIYVDDMWLEGIRYWSLHYLGTPAERATERLNEILNNNSLTTAQKVEAVQNMNHEELYQAMVENSQVVDQIAALENEAGGAADVSVSPNVSAFDATQISIIGASLNAITDDSRMVTLLIDEPAAEHTLNGQYDSSLAVNFSMDLQNVSDTENLQCPVRITLPIPNTIPSNQLVILHYHSDGTAEELPYNLLQEDDRAYAQFVLASFSDFVMTRYATAETPLLGDVTGDGKVTAADYSRLLAHVKKISLITDEGALWAADVTQDGKITATDYSRLLAHVKKLAPLW